MSGSDSEKVKQVSFLSGWKDVTAGVVGGMCLVFAGHPLDTIKVRLQTMPKPAPGQAPLFTGALDCAVKTVKQEGIKGLYKGMGSPLTGVPPIYAVVFGAYGASKRFLQKSADDPLSLGNIFLAGCITGVATTAITAPVELIKARLQIQYAQPKGTAALYNGPVDCARKIAKTNGVSGLFRGSVATLWRDVPGSGAYFAANEWVKRMFIPPGGTAKDVGPLPLLLAGGCAGVANWLAIFPIDLIKSRVQTDLSGKYAHGHRGMYQVFCEVVAESGWRGLFKGIGPCLLRSFPANAACFTGYEFAMRLLDKV
ncbi:Mitochondrial carnitine/acylcarnitine carrier protein [Balamuthia mandrillaris]